MIENIQNITTKDGEMEIFTVHPDADGPHPAVILYMDAPGVREELYDFCRRIAGHGYFAILPDMYYRRGKVRYTSEDLIEGSPGRESMFEAMNSLSNQLVMEDTRAMLDFLAANPNVSDGPKGCIGYCMSGQYVVSAAGTYPDDFAAAVACYGVGIVTDKDDSPHLLAKNIKGELYFAFASDDPWVPDEVIATLRQSLDEHDVTYKSDIWPDTHHGFCFPSRPAYVEDATEKVWEIAFDLYKRTLS